jgi:hypothetical protein
MPISWNEIRNNAIAFSREWAGESREDAEAKSFWDAFFTVFGIKRRTVASFEEPVKKLTGDWGFIDLFWKATLLVEHKSRGKSLDKAHVQALDYIQWLKTTDREDEIPRYVVVSDFAKIALHDLDEDTSIEFGLAEFHKYVDQFAFIPGYKQHKLADEDPINIDAVALLGNLHDSLEEGGYSGHELERFLVRVLFCLFAEDTGLFVRNAFTDYIENHTREDGSDLGTALARLFDVLNKPTEKRQKGLLEELADLPYVNGDLFAEPLGFADFNRSMRNRLLACCRFDWSRISPAVFGSLFQSVMEPRERRQIGAHYTSERDILKLVRSLFLDDLRSEFERLKGSRGTQRIARLEEFHKKLGDLKFFDPACGCGNFLVVTYRELRLLEIELLQELHRGQKVLDVRNLSVLDVDAMYGIEIKEFPARIAEVAMWLVDHQMNQRLSESFGELLVRLPLTKSPHIHNANALRIDWKTVLPPEKCTFVLGNPPFVGAKYQTDEQRADFAITGGGGSRVTACSTTWPLGISRPPTTSRERQSRSPSSRQTASRKASKLGFCGASCSGAGCTFGSRTAPSRGRAKLAAKLMSMSSSSASVKPTPQTSASTTTTPMPTTQRSFRPRTSARIWWKAPMPSSLTAANRSAPCPKLESETSQSMMVTISFSPRRKKRS